MADDAVALVRANLHLSGYFTVTKYPVLEGHSSELDAGAVAEMTRAVMLSAALRTVVSDEWEDLLELAAPMLGVMRHCLGNARDSSPEEDE